MSEYEETWRAEKEYLETLTNFQWLVYPVFKMAEAVADKFFGCKRAAEAQNKLLHAKREKIAEEKHAEWEKEKMKQK